MTHNADPRHNEPKPQAICSKEQPLQSWKEIATYLDRDERTAQRWEKSAGLPVRRLGKGRGSSVYAYPSEIEAWRMAQGPETSEDSPKRLFWHWAVPVAISVATVGAGVLFIRYSPILDPPNPKVEAADGIVVREIWSGPTAEASGGPSPDGKYLSFVDWETGNLALRDIDAGTAHHLTDWAHPEQPWTNASNSIISPDGSLVAYSWCEDERNYCDLHVIRIDGSDEHILLSCKDQSLYPKSWSTSGESLVALKASPEGIEFLLIGLADGDVQVLKSGGFNLGPSNLALSPDDRFLAYDFPVSEQGNKHDIWLLKMDGNREVPLIVHPANDRLLGWIPHRETILFLSDREGTWDIWIATTKNGGIVGSPRPLRREVGEIRPMGFARDGTFFFRTYTRYFTLQTAPFDAETGKLQSELAQPVLGSNFYPRWSPDGEKLAYVREESAPDGRGLLRSLRMQNYETGEAVDLVTNLNVRFPSWSRDGRHIAFRGFDKKKRSSGYYQVKVEDRKVTPVVEDISEVWWKEKAEWSLDGKSIFYINDGSLMQKNLASNQETELYSDPDLTGVLKLSPDGRWLVFATDPSERGTGSLLIRSSLDGEARELFRMPKEAFRIKGASWRPDSKYILFILSVKNPGKAELWRVSPNGGDAEMVWQSEKSIGGISIHPDGQQISYSLYTQEFGIWAMEGYLAADN